MMKKIIQKTTKLINNNSSTIEGSSKRVMTNIQSADFSKKDIMSDDKNNT